MIGRTNAGLAPLKPKYSIKGWCATIGLAYADLSDITEPDMRILMSKHVSADYLLEWYNADNSMLDDFTQNAFAMKWIGLNDYICDKLLAISDAESRLLASEYWEYILKDHVPIMTADNAPYGTVIGDASAFSSYYLWHAFDGDPSSEAFTNTNTSSGAYIGYMFTNPISIRRIKGKMGSTSSNQTTNTVFEYYDGAEWHQIPNSERTLVGNYVQEFDDVECATPYCMGIRIRKTGGTAKYFGTTSLQFYGRSLNVSVPTMTSNTQPYGEAYISYDIASYAPYYLFDKNDSTVGKSSSSSNDDVCFGYDFGRPMVCKGVRWKSADSSNTPRSKNIRVYGSNTDKYDRSNLLFTSTKVNLLDNLEFFENNEAYRYVFVCADRNISNTAQGFSTLDFYGVDYSDRTEREYIYDHGVELMPIEIVKINAVVEKRNGELYLEYSGGNIAEGFVVRNVDTTRFSIMRAFAGDKKVNNNFLCVVEHATSGMGADVAYAAISEGLPFNVYLDMSSCNQNYDIGVYNKSGYTITKIDTITEWWLE